MFVLQIGLFNQINLENCPGLTTLLTSGEGIEDLIKLSPEAILLRWVNHHLEKAGVARYLAYLWDQGFSKENWHYVNRGSTHSLHKLFSP